MQGSACLPCFLKGNLWRVLWSLKRSQGALSRSSPSIVHFPQGMLSSLGQVPVAWQPLWLLFILEEFYFQPIGCSTSSCTLLKPPHPGEANCNRHWEQQNRVTPGEVGQTGLFIFPYCISAVGLLFCCWERKGSCVWWAVRWGLVWDPRKQQELITSTAFPGKGANSLWTRAGEGRRRVGWIGGMCGYRAVTLGGCWWERVCAGLGVGCADFWEKGEVWLWPKYAFVFTHMWRAHTSNFHRGEKMFLRKIKTKMKQKNI